MIFEVRVRAARSEGSSTFRTKGKRQSRSILGLGVSNALTYSMICATRFRGRVLRGVENGDGAFCASAGPSMPGPGLQPASMRVVELQSPGLAGKFERMAMLKGTGTERAKLLRQELQ